MRFYYHFSVLKKLSQISCIFLQLAYISWNFTAAQFSNVTFHSLMTLYSNITKKTTPNRQQRSNFEVVVQPCTDVAFIGNLEWCRGWVAAEELWPNATSIRMKRALIIHPNRDWCAHSPIANYVATWQTNEQNCQGVTLIWSLYLRNSILSEKNSNFELEWGNKGLM